jgi:signal recognition particle GTPase
MKINFKLSTNGIKKIFGNEAKLYIKKDLEKTETDKTIDALREFGYEYENDSEGKCTKLYNLRRIEKKYNALTFFKTLQNIITKDEHRFILYDVTKDYLTGEKSDLPTTLNDIYGHTPDYFTELRSFLDDKHELIEKDFLEVEKSANIENTVVSVTNKILEFLYGENADIYIRSVTGRNIIENEKIKAKELFYSDTVQKQIDMLRESLEQKKLEAMQERLAKKGLPKGVAVLLYGAPGTGKTETVYQLAKKTNRKISAASWWLLPCSCWA